MASTPMPFASVTASACRLTTRWTIGFAALALPALGVSDLAEHGYLATASTLGCVTALLCGGYVIARRLVSEWEIAP